MARCGPHVLLRQWLSRLRLAPSQYVLSHHDRTIDDDAEVEGAERQHARRHVSRIHQDENRNHGQGNRHRDDERAARTTEEKHQNNDYQADALDQRVANLAHGGGDEVATVENGDDVNILGLELLAQFLDLGVDAADDLRHVRVLEPHDDTLDRRWVLVQSQDSLGFLVRVAQDPEIANKDRHAVALGHDYIAEIVERAHESDAANDEVLVTSRYPAAAAVVDTQPVTQELGRVQVEPELPGEAAEIVDVRNTWDLPQRRLDDPALILR